MAEPGNKLKQAVIQGVSLTLFFCLVPALVLAAAPKGALKINNDAPYTNTTAVTLNLSATSTGTGVSQMRFSTDNRKWSSPEAYTTTKAWTLTSANGKKTVYVKFKDNAKKWSVAYSDTIILNDLRPKITKLTPIDGFTFYENDTVQILPTVSNGGGLALEYQFSLGGAIKQPWSSQSSYTWTAAFGSHNIKVEVRNKAGQDTKEVSAYVFRKPISIP